MAEKLTPEQAQAQIAFNIIKQFMQNILRPFDLEFKACTEVLEHLREISPEVNQAIDIRLSASRTSPTLQEKMHQKYQVDLDAHLQEFVDDVQRLDYLEQMLQNWKPGPLN
jgi:hypothetical protein